MSNQQRTRFALALAVGSVVALVLALSIRIVWAQFDNSNALQAADPYEIDSDGDSLSDGIEDDWNSDPHDPDSHLALDELSKEVIAQLDGERKGEVPREELTLPEVEVSVAAWVHLPASASGVIVSQGSYTLAVVDGHLAFEVSLGGRMWPLVAPITIPDDGLAHFVSGSFDGRVIKLHVDQAAPIAIAHPDVGTIDSSDQPLVIGDVKGSVADVRVYARALQDGEVRLLEDLTAKGEESK